MVVPMVVPRVVIVVVIVVIVSHGRYLAPRTAKVKRRW